MESHVNNTTDLQKQLVDYDDVELDESASGLLATSALSAPPVDVISKLGSGGLYGQQFGDHLNSGSSTAQNSLNASNNLMLTEEK